MSEVQRMIAAAQATLEHGQVLFNDLSIGNVDEQHPTAYENPGERRRRVDAFERQVAETRGPLGERFPSADKLGAAWAAAISSIGQEIELAFRGRYPSGSVADDAEASSAADAVGTALLAWEESVAAALGTDCPPPRQHVDTVERLALGADQHIGEAERHLSPIRSEP